MQSDELNTIIVNIVATESASRTVIPPSSGTGEGQEMTGFMKLLIYGGILLLFGIIFFIFMMISSPIWVVVGTILLINIIGFLWVCGMAAALAFGLPWMYKYLRGTYPLGSDWVDNARNQITGTAGQMRDYASIAREEFAK
ncbi:hypothetical protein MKW98_020393 [Papaver atlanticum]|uniref:Oleosin n=1 Tax=Papaver atlanticum TaxID=357466 RepID=A0AAD4RVL1_9MAGN|nr:hypothetical protein MKW98_020393 [Papaver atlanticum]